MVQATLQATLATTYSEVGLYAPAVPLQKAALRTYAHHFGNRHPETLTLLNNMGIKE